MFVGSFNLLGLTVSEKTFNAWKLERKKNETKLKGWIRAAAWVRFTRNISSLSTCVPSFNLLGLTVHEKSVTKKFNVWKLERKKNEEIKGRIRAAAWFRYARYSHPLSTCVTSFKNKRMNKQEQLDSGIHDTSAYCPRVYQVSVF